MVLSDGPSSLIFVSLKMAQMMCDKHVVEDDTGIGKRTNINEPV